MGEINSHLAAFYFCKQKLVIPQYPSISRTAVTFDQRGRNYSVIQLLHNHWITLCTHSVTKLFTCASYYSSMFLFGAGVKNSNITIPCCNVIKWFDRSLLSENWWWEVGNFFFVNVKLLNCNTFEGIGHSNLFVPDFFIYIFMLLCHSCL